MIKVERVLLWYYLVMSASLASGCHDQQSRRILGDVTVPFRWARVPLVQKSNLEQGLGERLKTAAQIATASIRQERLEEPRQFQSRIIGFNPSWSFSLDSFEAFRPIVEDGKSPSIVIGAITEDGVAHVYQQNLLYVALVCGDEIISVDTLFGDLALTQDGLQLWRSERDGRFRLFLVTTGSIFQGTSSLDLTCWDIALNRREVIEALRISGRETNIHGDAFSLIVRANYEGMCIALRLGNDFDFIDEEYKDRMFLNVGLSPETATVKLVGQHSAIIHMY